MATIPTPHVMGNPFEALERRDAAVAARGGMIGDDFRSMENARAAIAKAKGRCRMNDAQAEALRLMAAAGVTQAELARRVGRAQSHVSYHLHPYAAWKRPHLHRLSLRRMLRALER